MPASALRAVLLISLAWLVYPVTTVTAQRLDALSTPSRSPHMLLLNPVLDMRAGAESLLTPHSVLAAWQDARLGTRWVDERSRPGKGLGIAGRLGKLILIDVPTDYFTVVLLHEFFGHGGRYREFDIGGIDYGFDLPPPYGDGGGQASTEIQAGTISTHELIAVWTGGLESEQVLNHTLRQRWVRSGHIPYREAWLYFWSFQIGMTYVEDTQEELVGLPQFNDPQAYVFYVNQINGYTNPDRFPFTVADLKRLKRRDALDPFLFLGLLTQLHTYVWSGHSTSGLPMLQLGDLRYLPSVHTNLTPFGVETRWENILLYNDTLYEVSLGRGDRTFHSDWGGLTFSVSPLLQRKGLRVDGQMSVWRQPRLQLGPAERSKGSRTGGAVSARLHLPLRATRQMDGVLEVGFKTAGNLEGYALDASPILLAGVQF